MKLRSILLSSIGAATLWGASADLSGVRAARLFEVDYRPLHNSGHADAQFAKGSPKGQILQEARPRYDVEPMEAINRGLMVGDGCASVRYESEGNLNPIRGSVEVVFTNYLWDWDARGVHIFMQCLGQNTTLYVYKHHLDGVGAYLGVKSPKWSFFPRQTVNKLKGRGPNHLLLTYSPEAVRLYRNGLLVREGTPETKIEEWGRYFSVGPAGKFGRDGRTTIACVATYDRPLTAEEVMALAASRIPSLKLEGVKVEKRIDIPGSTFLKNPGKHGMEALADDYVVSPWSPVEYKDGKFRVWNREYDFSGGQLVTQIVSGGEKMLRDGVNLYVTREGKTEAVKFSTDLKFAVDAKGRKSFLRSIVAPAWFTGTVLTSVEYDGTTDFSFDLKGIDQAENFVLDAAMARPFSDAVHYVGTTWASMRSIVCPDISYSRSLANRPGEVFNWEFLTHIWVGGTSGGLQFYHNSDQPFWPKDRKDCFKIFRNDKGEADLQIRYATEKTPAPGGELHFRCGFTATPVRPMPANWRAWNFSAQYDSFVGDRRGTHLVYWPDYWKTRIMLDPDPQRALAPERNRARIERDRAEGRKVIPYWDHRHIGSRRGNVYNPDVPYIRQYWGPEPQRKPSGSEREYIRVFSETGYTDYLARCVLEYSKIMGTIDGVYIDEMENIPNSRAASNGGYVNYDGARRYTFGIYGDRAMYKRLDAVVRSQNGGVMPSSIAHCSGTHMMEVLSHFPIFLTAEHLYSGYFPDSKELIPPENDRLYYYSYALPMDRVKTEFYHKMWGSVIVFLPCLKNQRDIMTKVEPTRDLLSRVMHADVLFWPLWCNSNEIYKVEDFRRRWDIGNAAVKFIPYWENREIVSDTPGSCISYYDKNGEKLVIVSNLARKPQTLTVKLPAGTTSVVNAETEAQVPIRDGKVALEMKRNDYCALIVKK